MPMTPEDIERFNAALRQDAQIDTYAHDSARETLERHFKFRHHPRQTPDQVFIDQAAPLIEQDLRDAEGLGLALTPQEQEHYRQRFTAAYLAMFRDKAVYMQEWERYKATHKGGYIIVCYR